MKVVIVFEDRCPRCGSPDKDIFFPICSFVYDICSDVWHEDRIVLVPVKTKAKAKVKPGTRVRRIRVSPNAGFYHGSGGEKQ